VTALGVLALAASITSIGNSFVQDDLPIVRMNAEVHSLHLWRLFTHSYWPDPYPRELYRPLTSVLLSLEWVAGGGWPLLYRLVSILLYMVASWAVYRLARRLLDPGPAWLAAALFAVDPVHVEAIALAVNQAELVVATLLCLLTTWYIDRRRSGEPLTWRWITLFAAGYLAAALFKEHALLLPGLLAAAELTVISDERSWTSRARALRPLYLTLVLAAVCSVAARTLALGGDVRGSFIAEALSGLSLGGRALTMLGVVPYWARLFLWPAHLQADYSPQEIVAATHWGAMQSLGALILVVSCGVAWYARRRLPALTFGILWAAVGLVLVSNVLIPTGIVLAERTLFLATVGVAIGAGAVLWRIGEPIYRSGGSLGRIGTMLVLMALLVAGAVRSAFRELVWRDHLALWSQTVVDAPLSYRAHEAYGAILFEAGEQHQAEMQYKESLRLFQKAWTIWLNFADRLREHGRCDAALYYYGRALQLAPNHLGARASEVACLIDMGDYRKAAAEARQGAGYSSRSGALGVYAHIADSAWQAHAPPHTVRLPPPPTDSAPPR
jgi:tetratricopeptide (TPR) repeat protein